MKSRRKTQLVCYPLKLVKELEHGRWGSSMLTMKAKKWEKISWQIEGVSHILTWLKINLIYQKMGRNISWKQLVSPMNFLKQFQSQLNVLESKLEMKVIDWLMQSVLKISHKCTALL